MYNRWATHKQEQLVKDFCVKPVKIFCNLTTCTACGGQALIFKSLSGFERSLWGQLLCGEKTLVLYKDIEPILYNISHALQIPAISDAVLTDLGLHPLTELAVIDVFPTAAEFRGGLVEDFTKRLNQLELKKTGTFITSAFKDLLAQFAQYVSLLLEAGFRLGYLPTSQHTVKIKFGIVFDNFLAKKVK